MTYFNPLHNYRSYSYKHILIACNTTIVAERIGSLSNEAIFSEIITQKGPGGRPSYEDGSNEYGVIVKSIGDSGEYAILINGFSDGDFFISKCEWETWLVPSYSGDSQEDSQLQTTGVTTTGSMVVVEPRGFKFFNAVNSVMKSLGSGPQGTVWVLKTVFVGHNDNGTSSYLSNVEPFLFAITDFTGSFSEAGATYTISFVGQSNGISKSPQYSKTDISTLPIPKNKTLVEVMQLLCEYLNTTNKQKWDEAVKSGQTKVDPTGEKRPVLYNIQLDPYYSTSEFVIDLNKISNTGTGSNTGGYINFGNSPDIENVINMIMMRCQKVMDDASASPRKIYKIHSNLESDKNNIFVKIIIKPMVVPQATNLTFTELIPGTNADVVEFNYIYTGKNTDVLQFDINMALGFAFFQQLIQIESVSDDQSTHNTKPIQIPSIVEKTSYDPDTSDPLIPIIPDNKVVNKSVKNPHAINKFLEAINRFATIETLEASMSIVGNPIFLGSFSTPPSKLVQNNQPSETGTFKNWHSSPSLCKVNISMPSNNTLLGVNEDGTGNFQVPFWYQGLYLIIYVKHSFDMGEFTQQLNMKNVAYDDTTKPLPVDYSEQTNNNIVQNNI